MWIGVSSFLFFCGLTDRFFLAGIIEIYQDSPWGKRLTYVRIREVEPFSLPHGESQDSLSISARHLLTYMRTVELNNQYQ